MKKKPSVEIVVATVVPDVPDTEAGIVLPPTNPYPNPARHPARVYLKRLAPGSRAATQNVLELFARAILERSPPPPPRPHDSEYRRDRDAWLEEFWRFPWHELRYQHVAGAQTRLTEMRYRTSAGHERGYAHTVINRTITAMRRVLKESRRLGQIRPDDYTNACDIESIIGERLPKGRFVESDEIVEIVEKCGDQSHRRPMPNLQARDTAAVTFAWGSGPRRADVASAMFENYDRARKTLSVVGKRNKQRLIQLPPETCKAFDAWIAVRGTAPGPLFHPISKSDRILAPRGIHPKTVGAILQRITARSETLGSANTFTSHDLRRTYISNEIDKGVDLATIAKTVGQSDVNITASYDRREERAMRKAADATILPTRQATQTTPIQSRAELTERVDFYVNVARTADEKRFADAAEIANWDSYDFCKEVFTSSGSERRFFDSDGVSGKRLSRLILGGKVTIEIHRFPKADQNDERMNIFPRKGNESIEHSQLKLSAFLWLVSHFKPTDRTITSERPMVHGIPDLFLSEPKPGVWVECGDTEARKVLKALLSGYSCLLVPFACCEPIGGILLRIKTDELSLIQEEDRREAWANHAGKGLLY